MNKRIGGFDRRVQAEDWYDDLSDNFDDLFDEEGHFLDKVGTDKVASRRRRNARRALERMKERIALSEALQDYDHYLN